MTLWKLLDLGEWKEGGREGGRKEGEREEEGREVSVQIKCLHSFRVNSGAELR